MGSCHEVQTSDSLNPFRGLSSVSVLIAGMVNFLMARANSGEETGTSKYREYSEGEVRWVWKTMIKVLSLISRIFFAITTAISVISLVLYALLPNKNVSVNNSTVKKSINIPFRLKRVSLRLASAQNQSRSRFVCWKCSLKENTLVQPKWLQSLWISEFSFLLHSISIVDSSSLFGLQSFQLHCSSLWSALRSPKYTVKIIPNVLPYSGPLEKSLRTDALRSFFHCRNHN